MPAHKPHSPSYSLKDLVLVMAFVEFILSMAAAVLMRYHNGIVNDIICVFGIALDARGSIVEWIDGRKQKERLHKMLRERGARWTTNSSGNASSAQIPVIRPVDVTATRKSQDRYPNVDQNVIVAGPTTTMNTNTHSSVHIHSTYSLASLSASNESPVSSQTEKSRAGSQNQKLIQYTKGDGVEMDMKQFAAALTQEHMEINTVPLTRYLRSTVVPPPLDASLPAEVKGKNEEVIAIRPAIVGTGVGTDIRGHPSSSMKRIAVGPTRTGLNTFAGEHNSQYNTQLGAWRTITNDNPLTTGAISLVPAARSTSSGAQDASLLDDPEVNQILHPTTKEGDAARVREFMHMEAPQGGLENVAVGSRRYEKVAHAHAPLTKTNTDEIGESPSPIVNDDALATNAISAIHVASSTLLGAPDLSPLLQAEVSTVDKGMRPNIEHDGAGKQEHVEAIRGKHGAGQCEEQIAVIHDGPMRRSTSDTAPSTARRTFLLISSETNEGEKKEEHVEVTPDEM